MTKTASVHTEGADIVYDHEGAGPLLLLIAGAGGEAHRYEGLSSLLKDDYTVVRYDRRCCTRSTGDKMQPISIAQQARDAVAIITHLGADQAYIFGSSGGGTIACEIAASQRHAVTGMVVHEPAIQTILPDADEMVAFMDAVEAKLEAEGTMPAMIMFAGSLRGMPPPSAVPAGRPGLFTSPNGEFFMRKEFHGIGHYKPDVERIRQNQVAMITTSGRLSEDVYYARTAQVLADQINCPYRQMSGHHLAYAADPSTFAAELRPMLHDLKPK